MTERGLLKADDKITALVQKRFGQYHLLRTQYERDLSDAYRRELQELVKAAKREVAAHD